MDARKTKFLVTGGVIVAAMVALFAFSLNQPGAAYYITLDEFLPQGALDGGNFRLTGKVLPGSIEREPGGMKVTFTMVDGPRTLPVHYEKETPDTFVDNADVVVEGEMGPDGTFFAHTLLAKCPSKYEAEGEPAAMAGG